MVQLKSSCNKVTRVRSGLAKTYQLKSLSNSEGSFQFSRHSGHSCQAYSIGAVFQKEVCSAVVEELSCCSCGGSGDGRARRTCADGGGITHCCRCAAAPPRLRLGSLERVTVTLRHSHTSYYCNGGRPQRPLRRWKRGHHLSKPISN